MTRKKINFISAAAAFAFVLILTSAMPYVSDDWHFKFVFYDFIPTENDRRAETLGDILISLKNYYRFSGGRIFSHGIIYIVNLFDKCIFNVLNAAVFSVFGILIYKIAEKYTLSPKLPMCTLPLIYAASFVFLPDVSDTVVWLAGSINYLWMMTVVLGLFLLVPDPDKNFSAAKYTGLCVLSLLSGMTNEVSGGMIIVFAISYFFQKKKLPSRRFILPAILVTLGACIVILAPGNAFRAREFSNYNIFSISDVLDFIPIIASWYIKNYSVVTGIILISCLMLFDGSRSAVCGLSFLISGLAGLFALALSGSFTTRSTFTPISLIMISFVISVLRLYFIYGENGFASRCTVFKTALCCLLIIIQLTLYLYFESAVLAAVTFVFFSILTAVLIITIKKKTIDLSEIKSVFSKFVKYLKAIPYVSMLCLSLYIGINTVNYFREIIPFVKYKENLRLTHTAGQISDEAYRGFEPHSIFISSQIKNIYGIAWENLYNNGDE